MSEAAHTPEEPSRQTNQNKCENQAESDDLPTCDDVLWAFIEEFPDLVDLPVAVRDGTGIREDYADMDTESWEAETLYQCDLCEGTFASSSQTKSEHIVDAHGDVLENTELSPSDAADAWIQSESVSGERISDIDAVPWSVAVEKLLQSHDRTRNTTINLRYGWPRDPEFAEFSFSASDRWSPEYQREMYGQCHGWLRELTGGTRPSGGETEGIFENPSVAFLTRSASSMPDGDRIGPVDHAEMLRNPWRECYQNLRYTLDSLGFETDDYQYWRVLEPHPGEGQNQGYAHEHIILVVDGEISQSDLAPVMETHVSATDGAGVDAHTNTPCPEHDEGNPWDDALGECDDCDTPVSVRDPESVESLAAYVADYASIDPLDLFERPPSYIAWAAAMTAGNVRSVSRSDPARWAALADRCKQQYESDISEREHDHGDRLTVSTKGSNTVECAHCGSPHGIDQSQTLSKHRLSGDSDGDGDVVVADGGSTELWDAWVAAWRACRPSTVDKVCNHPDGSNTCPLCAEYQGAVDASVPIPDHAYVPDDAYENEAVEYVNRIETAIRRHPNMSAAGLLGLLRDSLPDAHAEALIRGVLAGFERPSTDEIEESAEWGETRIPEWHVHSIEIDGEEVAASAGNGVTMVEVRSASETWSDPHGSDDADWRSDPFADPACNECESGRYELRSTFEREDSIVSQFICNSCDDTVLS